MASLRTPAPPPHLHFHNRTLSLFSPGPRRFTILRLSRRFSPSFSGKLKSSTFRESSRNRRCKTSFHCVSDSKAGIEKFEVKEGVERPPFDINLAVILAGFAFEAYTSPPEIVGRREMDAAGCKAVYLSESFVREIYDGQLLIKLKKGIQLPAMDPWGTSDPYVVMELDGQVVKSKVKWGTKEPTWNEDFTFNLKLPTAKKLQVAAWDANLVTPHKRMGNTGIDLESLSDGNLHEMVVELEGMGGGGKIQLEVKFKSFEEIEEERKWWRIPFVVELLQKNGFGSALKSVVGSEAVPAREFVEYAFGQLKSINETYSWKDKILKTDNYGKEGPSSTIAASEEPSSVNAASFTSPNDQVTNEEETTSVSFEIDSGDNGHTPETKTKVGRPIESDKHFWKNFADKINLNVVQKLGVHLPNKVKWDGLDLLNRIGTQSRKIAEENYIEAGLATPETPDVNNDKKSGPVQLPAFQTSLPDIKKVTQDLLQQTDMKKVTQDLLQQTDSVLGAFVVLAATVSHLNKDGSFQGKRETGLEDESDVLFENDKLAGSLELSVMDEKKAEEMKVLFSTAESAMEAWAMLATSLGHPSFIKSEFEKICFLDNATTDTQVAIWRDPARGRLVIAFRGTEQSRWKDLRTDLMLAPAGLNPERIGGDFRQEVQVHSGFLSAYDSVRIRIISLLKMAIGYREDEAELKPKWHVYVTGHSLGGALATLLCLELSSSQLAKRGAVCVTMYNFGSPRVGNKRFAELYNEKVKDSWRVVNHRDIIPSVPRLMGYCHVAQPIYLGARNLQHAMENVELLGDGYEGDVIGEYTPDVLVTEFMKGEKELIEKILLTEINIYRSIRDGSALMQHMEDFYYITLLELVRSNYQNAERMQANLEGSNRELTA